MKIFECGKCGSGDIYIKENGSQVGLYCGDCGRWLKWIGKDERQLVERYIEDRALIQQNDMKQEEKVLKMLADIWNEFIKLDKQHPDEQRDFCDGMHKCQSVIGMRFARRYRGDIFPIKNI